MKKLILFSTLLITTHISYAQTDFSNGYKSGWKAGYCFQEDFCSSPIPPSAPMPNLNKNSFQDGYNRGFIDGKASKSSKVQNQRQTNNNLIEGAGKAYGDGITVNGSSAFDKYNASNNYGIQRRAALPSSPRNSEYFTVSQVVKNANSVVLILNGYFSKSSIKSTLAANGIYLIDKKYYTKEDALDIDFKKLNKKEKSNLSIENVVCVRYDAIRYNSSSDYKYKIRIFDNQKLYFDGDFENISSGEGLYYAIKAVNEIKK